MLSLAPAASTFGWLASTASAGSFCLFCENGVDGLPIETRASALSARATPTMAPTASAAANRVATNVLIGSPLPNWVWAESLRQRRAEGRGRASSEAVALFLPVVRVVVVAVALPEAGLVVVEELETA